jgi:hypothetical protein
MAKISTKHTTLYENPNYFIIFFENLAFFYLGIWPFFKLLLAKYGLFYFFGTVNPVTLSIFIFYRSYLIVVGAKTLDEQFC